MILLDTHVLIWWLSDDSQLSTRSRRLLRKRIEDGGKLFVSTISTWEISMLVNRGRLRLRDDLRVWIRKVEAIDAIQFVSVDNQIAIESTQLPEPLHRDPADRMIVATARLRGQRLVTADQKLRDYPHVETFW